MNTITITSPETAALFASELGVGVELKGGGIELELIGAQKRDHEGISPTTTPFSNNRILPGQHSMPLWTPRVTLWHCRLT